MFDFSESLVFCLDFIKAHENWVFLELKFNYYVSIGRWHAFFAVTFNLSLTDSLVNLTPKRLIRKRAAFEFEASNTIILVNFVGSARGRAFHRTQIYF